ncbi:MAG: M48 family metallopeptidase [Treponemataceae bacterium]
MNFQKIKRFLFVPLFASFLLTGCFSTRNELAGRGSFNVISVEEEVKMGSEAYDKILAEETLSKDPKYLEQVKRVSARLVAAVGNDMPQAEWAFNVIESEEINAFALPGGKVAIYTALLEMLDDDELAFVLGHEIAHVTLRHGSERMSKQMLVQIGGAAIQILLKGKSEQTTKAFLSAYGVGSQVGILLPYSRENEYEADRFGVKYAAKAGYQPEATLKTLRKFQSLNQGAKKPEFLSTHPLDENRIQKVEELIQEMEVAK